MHTSSYSHKTQQTKGGNYSCRKGESKIKERTIKKEYMSFPPKC